MKRKKLTVFMASMAAVIALLAGCGTGTKDPGENGKAE